MQLHSEGGKRFIIHCSSEISRRCDGSVVNLRLQSSIFIHLFAGGCIQMQTPWKPLARRLNKPPQHWKCILHTEGCHHRNGCSQLQNMAAPTSQRSCVCMDLGFKPATHQREHWPILQRTTASFCLNYPDENNGNILLRHVNAAGCSRAWTLLNA